MVGWLDDTLVWDMASCVCFIWLICTINKSLHTLDARARLTYTGHLQPDTQLGPRHTFYHCLLTYTWEIREHNFLITDWKQKARYSIMVFWMLMVWRLKMNIRRYFINSIIWHDADWDKILIESWKVVIHYWNGVWNGNTANARFRESF